MSRAPRQARPSSPGGASPPGGGPADKAREEGAPTGRTGAALFRPKRNEERSGSAGMHRLPNAVRLPGQASRIFRLPFMRRGVFRFRLFFFALGLLGSAWIPAPGTSALAVGAQRSPELWIIDHGDATALAVRRLGGVEMVRLAEVAAALGGTVRPGADERQAVLRLPNETVRFDAGRSFVRVGDATRVLRNPSVRRGGEWFVPLDFVSLVLPDILPGRTRYDGNARTLAVGEGYPRLEVEIASRPGSTRVIVRTDPPVPLDIEEGGGAFRSWCRRHSSRRPSRRRHRVTAWWSAWISFAGEVATSSRSVPDATTGAFCRNEPRAR